MKTEANALVLLKKGPVFLIATFFKKLFFFKKKEAFEEVITEEQTTTNYQEELEENRISTGDLSIEQIKSLEKTYQREIESLEHQIKLLETRNRMCEFKIQIYKKEKSVSASE